MNKYKVIFKEVYTYSDVIAKTKKEAIRLIYDMDWRDHDEQDRPLEIKAILEK